MQPGLMSDSQRFVLQVSLNTTSAAFSSDHRENLSRSLTALPSATTGRARSLQALLAFPEEGTELQHRPFPPGGAAVSAAAGGRCRSPRAVPRSLSGAHSSRAPVTAMAGAARGCRGPGEGRARRPPAPCAGRFISRTATAGKNSSPAG